MANLAPDIHLSNNLLHDTDRRLALLKIRLWTGSAATATRFWDGELANLRRGCLFCFRWVPLHGFKSLQDVGGADALLEDRERPNGVEKREGTFEVNGDGPSSWMLHHPFENAHTLLQRRLGSAWEYHKGDASTREQSRNTT
jgi:hypothetical protein